MWKNVVMPNVKTVRTSWFPFPFSFPAFRHTRMLLLCTRPSPAPCEKLEKISKIIYITNISLSITYFEDVNRP